jgi:probable addiction module antidote protein
MEAIKLRLWNSAEHLKTEEDIALYLEACMKEGDPAQIEHAKGIIARARKTVHAGNDNRPADED